MLSLYGLLILRSFLRFSDVLVQRVNSYTVNTDWSQVGQEGGDKGRGGGRQVIDTGVGEGEEAKDRDKPGGEPVEDDHK